MNIDTILAFALGLSIFAVFIQMMVNYEQNIINKAIQKYIDSSNEKFKQIDEELKNKIDKLE